MEELIGLVGFGLGASLGAGLVRSVTGGGRSTLRQAFKMGIQAWDAVAAGASTGPSQELESDLVLPGSAPPGRPARSRRRSEPQRIAIARE